MLDPMLSGDDIAPERIRPFTRREYERLVELAVLGADSRVELLRGMVVTMSPTNPPHAGTAAYLTEVLMFALRDRASVRGQSPFAATDDSEPQPDIAVVPRGWYVDQHPTEAYLLVEVSDSSIRIDLGVKRGIYAEAGVPEYWVVNVPADLIEVFTEPTPAGYTRHRTVGRGERLRLVSFPELELAVDELLPPRR